MFALSCSKGNSSAGQGTNSPAHSGLNNPKKESAINVPRNVKTSVFDNDTAKDTACILTMPNANEILLRERKLTKDTLGKEVADCLADVVPFKKIVYIKADDALEYGNIIDVLEITRRVQGDRIRFIVTPTDTTDNPKNILEAKVPFEPQKDDKIVKPNPLTLVVELTTDGKISLNADGHDTLESLSSRLKEVFKDRESNGVIREGTNEIEATVFVKAPRSMKYGEVIKAIDTVTGSGANPVGLQIDDVPFVENIIKNEFPNKK